MENEVMEAYKSYKKIPIRTLAVGMEKALEISCKYKVYAYDAYYLEVAKRLNLSLITFDMPMQNIALAMNIPVLNGEIK